MILTFSATQTRSDGTSKFEMHRVSSPPACLQTVLGIPTAKTFRVSSYCCRATSALAIIGGIVSIGLIESSSYSNPVKTVACIAGGLLVLSSYYCCKISSGYAFASDQSDQLAQDNDLV